MAALLLYVCDARGCEESVRVQPRGQAPGGWVELVATSGSPQGQAAKSRKLCLCPRHSAELLERVGGWQ